MHLREVLLNIGRDWAVLSLCVHFGPDKAGAGILSPDGNVDSGLS